MEPGIGEPRELRFDRVGEISRVIDGRRSRHRRQRNHDIANNEPTALRQLAGSAAKKVPFSGSVQMMDGECRHDQIPRAFGQEILEPPEPELDAIAESLGGDIEHRAAGIHADDGCRGVQPQNPGGGLAGSDTKVEHALDHHLSSGVRDLFLEPVVKRSALAHQGEVLPRSVVVLRHGGTLAPQVRQAMCSRTAMLVLMSIDPPPPAAIDGDGLRLRLAAESDIDDLHAITQESEIAPWWPLEGTPREEVMHPEAPTYVIEVDGETAGLLMFHEDDEPGYRSAGMDIAVSERFHRRGIGRRALAAIARRLFTEREHHRLTIDPAAANARAIASYERVGFRPVGIMRAYERAPDGTWRDGLLMDMLATELVEESGPTG